MSKKKSELVWFHRDHLKSPAWFDLTGKSHEVLGMFWYKRQMEEIPDLRPKRAKDFRVKNNGEIIFTYQEAREKYGISRQAFSRALDDLIKHGFIDIAVVGTGICGAPSKYAVSERWRKWGKPDFMEGKRRKRCAYRFPTGLEHPRASIRDGTL